LGGIWDSAGHHLRFLDITKQALEAPVTGPQNHSLRWRGIKRLIKR